MIRAIPTEPFGNEETCPVPDSFLAKLYRSTAAEARDLCLPLPEPVRARLALFCSARVHLRDLARTIAATCAQSSLMREGRESWPGPLGGSHAPPAGSAGISLPAKRRDACRHEPRCAAASCARDRSLGELALVPDAKGAAQILSHRPGRRAALDPRARLAQDARHSREIPDKGLRNRWARPSWTGSAEILRT